jgi:NitT/TauT family transport system substrate-binding protein
MKDESQRGTRRRFIASAPALAAASLLHIGPASAAEPPPETRRIRLVHGPWLCYAPQYVAEELLRLEGFTHVEFVKIEANLPGTLVKLADIAIVGAPGIVPVIDSGQPVAVLSGLHVGCWELFAGNGIHSITQLKGRSVAISGLNSVDHTWISGMLGYVGIDPRKEVEWIVTGRIADSQRMFLEGKADAFLGFPPQPQEVRARKVGQVLINTTIDRPWSQYFCCMVVTTQDFLPSGHCGRCSRPPISAINSRNGRPSTWWTKVTSRATRSPWTSSRGCPMDVGVRTTRPTPCAFTPYACTKSG